jgi:hypothetical protein
VKRLQAGETADAIRAEDRKKKEAPVVLEGYAADSEAPRTRA